jgi:hypothetical protein
MALRTLGRKLKEPEFAARLMLKSQVVSREIDANLRALAHKSTVVAAQLLDRDDRPDLQARVALGILPQWQRTRYFELDQRVSDLEELAASHGDVKERMQRAMDAVGHPYDARSTFVPQEDPDE